MQRIFLICLSLLVFTFFSCGGNQTKLKKMQAKIDSLQARIDSLETLCGISDEGINEYVEEMNKIYNNLEVIKINQVIINSNYIESDEELTGDKRALIQESINTIQKLMFENQLKIDTLKRKLRNAPIVNQQLEEWLNNLNQKVVAKSKEVETLNKRLATINIHAEWLLRAADSLNIVNNSLNTMNTIQDQELNTVYFCKGTFKELTANKVLDKGAFAVKEGAKLSSDVNMNYFTKGDKRKIKEIPVGAKKATLKTPHPTGSYTLLMENKKVTKLVINNAGKFWSTSKYCVLMLE